MSDKHELTVDDIAEMLGVRPNTVRRMLHRKELRGYQLSRKTGWRVQPEDVTNYLDEKYNRAKPSGQNEQPSLFDEFINQRQRDES